MKDYSELKRYAEGLASSQHAYGEGEMILALITENDNLREERDSQQRCCIRVIDESHSLKAENEALRKDAERYRWLRSHEPLTSEFYQGAQCRELRWGKRLDQLIDLALSKEG